MWQEYVCASELNHVLELLAQYGPRARIVAGATDLILELERGVRKGIDLLIDITRIPGLDNIYQDSTGLIHLGPLVTHNQCVASKLIVERGFPLAQAAWQVGSPQIRNRGTIAGNLITASPANDTIPPLIAMDARIVLVSMRGKREVKLIEFYTGVRKTVMDPDEFLLEIHFPALNDDSKGAFFKIGLRNAQAIAVVNTAVVITQDRKRIQNVAVALGSVAPTIIRSVEAERILAEGVLTEDRILEASTAAKASCTPISDIRGSSGYRREMVRVAVSRTLKMIAAGNERSGFPSSPALLRIPFTPEPVQATFKKGTSGEVISARINGKRTDFPTGYQKTLLNLLRDEAGLIGTKEGCAEGECGACTVIMDGMAVMSCLVPAPRAHRADIVTIEGLRRNGKMHPVQQAFIDAGAVQCGYCTPGFLMSGAMLLQEKQHLTREGIQQSLTGNLCRCTGYYKIIEAIENCVAESVRNDFFQGVSNESI